MRRLVNTSISASVSLGWPLSALEQPWKTRMTSPRIPLPEPNPERVQALLERLDGQTACFALMSHLRELVASYKALTPLVHQAQNYLYREGVERNTGQVLGDMGQWHAVHRTANDAVHAAQSALASLERQYHLLNREDRHDRTTPRSDELEGRC